jgi:hypothetical protein
MMEGDAPEDRLATLFRALMARRPDEIEREQLDAFYAALARVLAPVGPLSTEGAEGEGALCAAWFCRGQPAYLACVRALVGHMRPAYTWADHVRCMRECAWRDS